MPWALCGLPVGYHQPLAIVLYVFSRFVVYPLDIINLWPLYCMFFLALWFTRWVSSTFGHCTVCSFSLCGLPVGYHQLLTIVLYVLSRFVVYPLGIINLWPLYCMFFLALWFTRWVSSTFGHCIVCSFSLCGLLVGYHQPLAIVLYVLSRFVVYSLGIINVWPLYCMFFLALWLTRWVSSTFGHCIVCSFSLCGLPVGYHQPLATTLYVFPRFTVCIYPFSIFRLFPNSSSSRGYLNLWHLTCLYS